LANQTLQIWKGEGIDLLLNNRFFADDPGFNSPRDFDSTKEGDQTLEASAASTIIVSNANNDSILLGSDSTSASEILAHVHIGNTGPAGSLRIQDGARPNAASYTVNTSGITTADMGLNVTLLGGNVFSGGIRLVTGKGDDGVKVLGTRAGENPDPNSARRRGGRQG